MSEIKINNQKVKVIWIDDKKCKEIWVNNYKIDFEETWDNNVQKENTNGRDQTRQSKSKRNLGR